MRKDKLFATYMIDGEKRSILPDGGSHKVTEYHNYQWTWKAMAEYAKDWNKINEIEVMLGTEVRHAEARSVYSAAYGYDDRTLTSQPIIFPNESVAEQYPLHQETHAENAFVSWFATASYTLRHRFTVTRSAVASVSTVAMSSASPRNIAICRFIRSADSGASVKSRL